MDVFAVNPETGLEITRVIAARPETVWRCLSEAAINAANSAWIACSLN